MWPVWRMAPGGWCGSMAVLPLCTSLGMCVMCALALCTVRPSLVGRDVSCHGVSSRCAH